MKNLSAILITKNEEKNIGRSLNSIKDLVDEIIIVDSGSTDTTLEIAKKFTDKIFFRKWSDDYAAQKNFAISKTSGDWILSIDADEEMTTDLANEIKQFLEKRPEEVGIWIPRKNIIFSRWLKHGECWPDYQLKFFKGSSYFQRAVHEIVVLNGKSGFFKYPIIHHHYKNIQSFIKRAQKYTDIEAKVLLEQKGGAYFWPILAYPLAKFLKVYFYKRGFLDGRDGLIYACLLAYYSFLKRYKHYRISKK